MARNLSSGLSTAITDDVVYPFFAVDFEFDTAPLYVWTGVGTITIAGKAYTGSGTLIQVSEINETGDLAAVGCTLTCSGIPTQLVNLALTEPYQGRYCRIYLGVTSDLSTYTEVFTGFMDKMDIQEGQDTSTIVMSLESRLSDLERPRVRRFTASDQNSRFNTDRGLDFIPSLSSRKLVWGNQT